MWLWSNRLEAADDGRVLFAARNHALALFAVRWVAKRAMRSGGGRRRAAGFLSRLDVLCAPFADGPSAVFFQDLGACRRRKPKTRADLNVPKDASR